MFLQANQGWRQEFSDLGLTLSAGVNQGTIIFSTYYYYFNFLQTVEHSAELVCKGPSIYKLKAKILQKSTYF